MSRLLISDNIIIIVLPDTRLANTEAKEDRDSNCSVMKYFMMRRSRQHQQRSQVNKYVLEVRILCFIFTFSLRVSSKLENKED